MLKELFILELAFKVTAADFCESSWRILRSCTGRLTKGRYCCCSPAICYERVFVKLYRLVRFCLRVGSLLLGRKNQMTENLAYLAKLCSSFRMTAQIFRTVPSTEYFAILMLGWLVAFRACPDRKGNGFHCPQWSHRFRRSPR